MPPSDAGKTHFENTGERWSKTRDWPVFMRPWQSCYVEGGEFAEAEAAYRAELKIQPANSAVSFAYGGLLIKLGQAETAVPYLEAAVRFEPGLVPAYYQVGLRLLDNGRFAEAEKVFLRTIQIDVPVEMQISSHEKLIRIYKKLGSKQEAREQVKMLKWLRKQLATQKP